MVTLCCSHSPLTLLHSQLFSVVFFFIPCDFFFQVGLSDFMLLLDVLLAFLIVLPSLGLFSPPSALTDPEFSPILFRLSFWSSYCLFVLLPSFPPSLPHSPPPFSFLWYLEACIFCQHLQKTCFWFYGQSLMFPFFSQFSSSFIFALISVSFSLLLSLNSIIFSLLKVNI